jgi:hypothetical protein
LKGKTMVVSIPPDLDRVLTDRAAQRGLSTDDLVREALVWYLQIDPELLDELSAWQEARDEALGLIEEPSK